MLEVFAKFVEFIIMSIYGVIVINKLSQNKIKILNIKTVIALFSMSIIGSMLYEVEYNGMHTILVFIINIITYKIIFHLKFEDSLIYCGVMMFLTFIGDLLISLILRQYFSIQEIRSNWYLYILSTIFVSILSLSLLKIKIIKTKLQSFCTNLSKKTKLINNVFFVILVIGLSAIAQNITGAFKFEKEYIINILIMLIFFTISILFINSRNSYNELSLNYDSLFSYIQTFEDWIEKEQLNRHEYKNQLAVLRCMTKEKKVKNKIDEILEDNINIEGDVVHQLKVLPKGGIKGLMYYKVALAQKKKISVEVNVSLETKSELTKLKEKDIRVLCKLIGIYLDNAIEAATETRKKKVLIEVYELKDKVIFVFSNTFKKHKNLKDRNKKGVSSKGEGRGNGLYFASNLISKNEWISQKQEIIDGYYIQQLVISKNSKNKSHQ